MPGPSADLVPVENDPKRRFAAINYHIAKDSSITSSVRSRSGSGTVMPSALAVLRFMISSILVTCWIGNSEGFSP